MKTALGIAVVGQVRAAVLATGIEGPMPVHFGFDGVPDNFMAPWKFWWLMAAMQLGMLVLFWWIGGRADTVGRAARFNIGMLTGTATLFALLTCWTFYISVGPDPRLGWGTMLVMFVVSTLVGVVAGALASVPEEREQAQERTHPPRLIDATPHANVTWIGQARPATGPLILSGVASVGVLVLGIVLEDWLLIALGIGASLLMLATLWFTVTLDATGLRYRSLLRVPSRHIPFAELENVQAVDIPVGDYGGWGLRYSIAGDGRKGLITRGGEGIRVTHGGGKLLEITCTDARGAAGAWQAMR